MKADIALFFFRPTLGGGSTTYTAHLYEALRAAGANPVIIRMGRRNNPNRKTFGDYSGVEYVTCDAAAARDCVKSIPSLMTAPIEAKHLPEPDLIQQLVKLGMRTVIHDPNEFGLFEYLEGGNYKFKRPPFCIRPTMHRFYKDAIFIPHPFYAVSSAVWGDVKRKNVAGSTARIASVKRPKMLLEANRRVPENRRVQLRGAEYRMFTYNLQKKFGDVFQQSGGEYQFPKTFQSPVRVAAEYKLNFDLTYFPDDGGGTQYVQMEAMNAETVNVMHEDWWRFDKEFRGEMRPGKHVLTVSSVDDIVRMLKKPPSPDQLAEIVDNCRALLKKHAPAPIGKRYLEELT